MTTTEAIKREPQREATGAIAAPMPTDHSTSHPGGGASKNSRRPQAHFFGLLDRPTITKTKQTSEKTENMLVTLIATSPLMFQARSLRAPSAHPRDPESDSFLSCATKKKDAHATTQAVALIYARRCLSFGRCVTWCVIPGYSDCFCSTIRSGKL